MSARAPSGTGDRAGSDRLDTTSVRGAAREDARGHDFRRAGADDSQSVSRILSSLDRLGARIRALQPADDEPIIETSAATSTISAAESLQRAIEQISRKREAIERERADLATRERDDDGLADLGARVRALTGRDRTETAADRPAPPRPAATDRILAEIQADLRELRAQLNDIRVNAPGSGLTAAVDEVGERLARLTVAVDNPRIVGGIGDQLTDIRRLITVLPGDSQFQALADRLDRFAARLPDGRIDARGLDELVRGLGELTGAVAKLDRRDLIDDLGHRLTGIADHVVALEDRLGDFDGWRDASDRQATLMSQIVQRVEQVPRLAHEMERQSASVERLSASAEALPGLIADLETIRGALAGPTHPWDAVVERIDALTRQIEDGRNASMVSDGTLERRVADLADHIDAIKGELDARALAALDDHFAKLTSAFEDRLRTLAAPAGSPDELIDALGRIEVHLADTGPVDRLAALEKQVAGLAKSLETIDFAGGGDLASVDRLIAALHDEVTALGDKTSARIGEDIRALAEEMARPTASSVPAEALARIETRLTDIVDHLEARPDEMAALADALERLESSVKHIPAALSPADGGPASSALASEIAALRQEIGANGRRDRDLLVAISDAIEKLARRATAAPQHEPSRFAPADIVAREAVAAELAETTPTEKRSPSAATRPDSRTWQSIEKALNLGLARQAPEKTSSGDGSPAGKPGVGPITRPAVEDDESEVAAEETVGNEIIGDGTAVSTAAPEVAPEVTPEAGPEAAEAEAADGETSERGMRLFARRARAKAEAAAERQEPDFDVNAPLEPGSGKPGPRPAVDGKSPEGARASRPRKPDETPSKADFIAAARRAAMAASSEEALAKPAEQQSRSLLSRVRMPTISRNGNKILMTTVAVLLMIGVANIGFRLWSQFSGGGRSPVPAVTATATPIAMPKAAEAVPVATAPDTPVAAAATQPETALAATPTTVASGFSERATDLPLDSFAKPAGTPVATAVAPEAAAPAPTEPSGGNATAAASLPPAAVGPLALRQAAADGDPKAEFEVASRFAEGRGVETDLSQAITWFERAAEAGLAPAQYRLGSLYEKGQGTTRDLAKAAAWYEKAVAQGNAKAMHNLAVINAEGGLGTPNYQMAVRLFQQAADLGVRDSQFNLGILYARGLGVKRDLATSYKWFAIAANAGDGESAKKRDDVAQALSKEDLARARLAVETWSAKPQAPAANDVTIDNPAWTAAPDRTASVDTARLITRAQAFLAARGFDPGPADGRFGARTREAISAFQKANGLAVTGEIDRDFIAAMAGKAI